MTVQVSGPTEGPYGLEEDPLHSSLEGVGGLKTNEAYHSKADALLIPEMHFFLNYLHPFLEMLGVANYFGKHFGACCNLLGALEQNI